MKTVLARILALALVLTLAPVAQAEERIGAFVVFEDIDDVILLDGEIGINTPLEYRRAMAARPDAKVLVLQSPGGYVASALIMAGDIHDSGISTSIPEGYGCYSSCAFMFFAGKERLVEGELGVHQMFGLEHASSVQATVSDIIEALETFDTPTQVITRMFRTPSEEMYVFSDREIEDYAINRLGPAVLTTANLAKLSRPTKTAPAPTEAMEEEDTGEEEEAIEEAPEGPTYGPRIVLYGGLDFYGNDVSSERSDDVVQCAMACMDSNVCLAFTFNANPSVTRGPNCFLKSDVDRLEAYESALSGVFLPAGEDPASTYSVGAIDPTQDVLPRQGLSGIDFASSPETGIDTPGACRMACVDDKACQAFTFDARLDQCYLKHTPGNTYASSRLTSGIKRGASFPPLDVIDLSD